MANLLTCEGFADGVKTSTFDFVGGECIKGRLGIVIIFFIMALFRKWGGEEVGLEFSLVFSLIGSILTYFIIITIFASFKIAFILGIIAGILFGYGSGMIFGGE